MYYVYVLSDQGIPFYVGKGTGDRAYIHEKIVKGELLRSDEFGLARDYNPYKTRKIKKMLREGRNVEYSFPMLSDDEEQIYAEEKRLINLYGRKNCGGILTNIHPGGTGGDIWSGLSDERRQKLIEKKKEYVPSAETREKIRQASTGRLHTDKAKEKISHARAGKSTGPSSKKGLPATGNNAKGVRQAWNKDLDSNDPKMTAHKLALQKWYSENKEAVREKIGKPYDLIDPNGNRVTGIGIPSLVENYKVSYRIINLVNGKVNQYKGWRRAT